MWRNIGGAKVGYPDSSLTPEKLISCKNGILQAHKFVLALPSSELLSIGYNSLIVGGMATPTD